LAAATAAVKATEAAMVKATRAAAVAATLVTATKDGDDSADNGFDCGDRGRHGLIGASISGVVAAQVDGIAVDDRVDITVGGGADHGPGMPRLAIKPGSEDHLQLMVSNSNAVVAYTTRGLAASKAVFSFAAVKQGEEERHEHDHDDEPRS